ncbi:potassium transporter TrkG [Imperialibacter roseus]|uniref:Potassium transporter TrkG n=1 Tax=Imperialibacter roseus TaxID=1324217 RepID=A0ABZ0IGT1_9BACT|nr:potassium transporter TrkG [Imperialibacter roseus]WOK04213.1 potassium transporter TrkG [Imperialibacter roseus]
MKRKALNIINWSSLGISSVGLLLLIADVGFPYTPSFERSLHLWLPIIAGTLFALITAGSTIAWLLDPIRVRSRLFEAIFSIYLLVYLLVSVQPDWFQALSFFNHKYTGYWGCFFIFVIEFSRRTSSLYKLSKNPANLFIFSFALIVLVGSGLLMLPTATYEGIGFVDALFTSTSAVCVTGLIVVDTGSYFTTFGQVIILGLIQIGGIGILTFTSFFGLFFKGGFSIQNQLFLKDVTNTNRLAEVSGIVKTIIAFTLFVELIGGIAIFMQLNKAVLPSFVDRVLFAGFHSISAFCNAGFSTLGNSLYDLNYRFNYSLHLVIAFLFIFGGLGFPIVFNFINYMRESARTIVARLVKRRVVYRLPIRINLHTRIVLITTALLIIPGTLLFYFFEYDNTLAEHNEFGKWVTAFFGAVTPRTAGFNTVDNAALKLHTIMIMLLLMWIGASPGSTGGGIKTTTIFLATLNFLSLARSKDRVEFGKREISNKSVRRAFAIISLSLIFIGLATFMITMLDPNLPFIQVAFECFSAYSTVGLSMGITSSLSTGSRIVIILIMFIGRVGALTLLVGMLRRVHTLRYRYPNEELFIN